MTKFANCTGCLSIVATDTVHAAAVESQVKAIARPMYRCGPCALLLATFAMPVLYPLRQCPAAQQPAVARCIAGSQGADNAGAEEAVVRSCAQPHALRQLMMLFR